MAGIYPAVAQKKATKGHPRDTVKHSYWPTGVRVGTDLISIIKTNVTPSFKGWEMNGDLDFYRYYLAVDYGSWSRNYTLSNGNYQNNGTYYRFGTDLNFMLKDPDRNMFFIGFRYGHSGFNESLQYTYTDSVYHSVVTKSASNSGLKAHWVELTSGLRVKIWKGFWMGYTARVKFAPGVKGTKTLTPFDIPGYGLASKGNYWGLNYQLFWRFPIRKGKELRFPEK
jgi:hypothetical protein